MKGQVQSAAVLEEELDLFPQWRSHEAARRAWWSRLASLCLHLLVIGLIAFTPLGRGPMHDVQRVFGQFKEPVTLVAPPPELTQTAPNRGKVGKEFNLESLVPRPRVFAPPAVPPGAPSSAMLPEPPRMEIAQAEVPGLGRGLSGYPLPSVPSQDKPKMPVDNPAPVRAPEGPKPGSVPKITVPNSSIAEMGRELALGRGGRMIVEDYSPAPGGFPGMNPSEPTPGRTGSSLELLSDPGGRGFQTVPDPNPGIGEAQLDGGHTRERETGPPGQGGDSVHRRAGRQRPALGDCLRFGCRSIGPRRRGRHQRLKSVPSLTARIQRPGHPAAVRVRLQHGSDGALTGVREH